MNNRLFFFSLIFLTTQAHGMKRPCKELQQDVLSTKFPDYALWPEDIQNIIIDFSTHNTVAKKPKEATKTVRALVITNKKLNLLINDSNFNRNLINNFSRQFYCSHETIAKYLHTQEATKHLKLQSELKHICLFRHISHVYPNKNLLVQKLNELIKNGIDLEFTYNHNNAQKTPLMLSMEYDSTIFKCLINKKININNANSYGLTALKLATQWPVQHYHYRELLAHPDIAINQQNRRGESTLLHCLIHRKKYFTTDMFTDAIDHLLQAGADPELASNYGLTPLNAAIELKNEQAIGKIQRAIEKKHS